MWELHVGYKGEQASRTINVVDDAGAVRFAGRSVEDALIWLLAHGQAKIGVPIGDEIEVYRIEPRDELGAAIAGLTLRRDTAGQDPGQDASEPLELPLGSATRHSQGSVVTAKASHRRRRTIGR